MHNKYLFKKSCFKSQKCFNLKLLLLQYTKLKNKATIKTDNINKKTNIEQNPKNQNNQNSTKILIFHK